MQIKHKLYNTNIHLTRTKVITLFSKSKFLGNKVLYYTIARADSGFFFLHFQNEILNIRSSCGKGIVGISM